VHLYITEGLTESTPLAEQLFPLVVNRILGPVPYNPVKADTYEDIMAVALDKALEISWDKAWDLQDDDHPLGEAIEPIHTAVTDEANDAIYRREDWGFEWDYFSRMCDLHKDKLDKNFASKADAVSAATDVWVHECDAKGETVYGWVELFLKLWNWGLL
jgi:hypothetical protein